MFTKIDERYEELVEQAAKAICGKRSDHWEQTEDRDCAVLDADAALDAIAVKGMLHTLALALDKIAPCIVGWEDGEMPTFARELWLAVNPIQVCLGLPVTDQNGQPKND